MRGELDVLHKDVPNVLVRYEHIVPACKKQEDQLICHHLFHIGCKLSAIGCP